MNNEADRTIVVEHPDVKAGTIRIDFMGDGDCTFEMEDYDENEMVNVIILMFTLTKRM